MSNNKPFFCTAYCSKYVRWRSRQFGTSAEVSARQFGTGADLSGHFAHFGTNLMVPKCLGSEVSWVRSVLTPVLVLIEGKDYFNNILKHSGDSAQVWWVNIHNIHNAFHNHTNQKTAETVNSCRLFTNVTQERILNISYKKTVTTDVSSTNRD